MRGMSDWRQEMLLSEDELVRLHHAQGLLLGLAGRRGVDRRDPPRRSSSAINWVDTAPIRPRPFGGGGRPRARGSPAPVCFTKARRTGGGKQRCATPQRDRSCARPRQPRAARRGHDRPLPAPLADPEEDLEEGWSTLAEIKEQGLVSHIGVSNFAPGQMRRVESIAPVETLQPPYSLIERAIETDILPFAQRERIGVVAYSPIGSGLLSGAMTRRADRLAAGRRRAQARRALQRALSSRATSRWWSGCGEVGERHGTTPGAIAIAWTLRHPAVHGAVVGLRRPQPGRGARARRQRRARATRTCAS